MGKSTNPSLFGRVKHWTAYATIATGLGAGGYFVAERYMDNDFEQVSNHLIEFNDRIHEVTEESPARHVIHGLETITDLPESEAEACIRRADDLRLTESYTSQTEAVETTIDNIKNSGTKGGVIDELSRFLALNGFELIYNSITHPEEVDLRRRIETGNFESTGLITRFDDTTPEALDMLRTYAIGTVEGVGLFDPEFNQELTRNIIMTGDVKDDAVATTYWSMFAESDIVLELDHETDVEGVAKVVVHETGHAVRNKIMRANGIFFDIDRPLYQTAVPDGFRYSDYGGLSTDSIQNNHPEYFQPGPDKVFARAYGANNEAEHGSTTLDDTLYGGGIVLPGDASWGSYYAQNQASWLTCMEVMMPGFVDAMAVRDAERRGFDQRNVTEQYAVYFGLSPQQIYDTLVVG